MGSSNSRRNRTMSTSSEAETEVLGAQGGSDCPPPRSSGRSGSEDDQQDLQAILAYLIRSGQVRIVTQHEEADDDGDSSDYEFCSSASKPPKPDDNPDLSRIETNDLRLQILKDTGRLQKTEMRKKPSHLVGLIQNREIGRRGREQFTSGDQKAISCQYLPNYKEIVDNYYHKAFCGTYSKEGNIFLTAAQDQQVRIYNTENGKFEKFKTIRARDVGWSVLDTAFRLPKGKVTIPAARSIYASVSVVEVRLGGGARRVPTKRHYQEKSRVFNFGHPDGLYMAYSSWSDCIHLCNIYGEEDTHKSLHLLPGDHSFCIFSLAFSSDNMEILGGANDGCLYIYDRHEDRRTLQIDAHEDDVNAVTFADDMSHILFSGGDDGLIKVWDRRTLRDDNPIPVGILAGHADGITYIDSKGDARYLLSNSKDQTMKLWDIRMFSSEAAIKATKTAVSKQKWDYRWQQVPRKVQAKKTLDGDSSVMTYRGHSILHTLVRCHFSPQHTTGQRYAYTGCATGAAVVYDILTGSVVKKLEGHRQCVRDVSWHPYENTLVTTSWDGLIGRWSYLPYQAWGTDDLLTDSDSDSDKSEEEYRCQPRRSKRLLGKGRGSHYVGQGHRHGIFD